MSVYLKLFHGRTDPEEQLDDWGSNGPTLGPLEYVHCTYFTHLQAAVSCNDNREEAFDLFFATTTEQDMLYWDGVLYGDWTITSEPEEGFLDLRELSLDEIKSKLRFAPTKENS